MSRLSRRSWASSDKRRAGLGCLARDFVLRDAGLGVGGVAGIRWLAMRFDMWLVPGLYLVRYSTEPP